ncbi:MAG: hypothetical protein JWM98_433, partial [Thermoleophilia bacterium]|nr:hypothetical protein [Thermoleophilia bacterium]
KALTPDAVAGMRAVGIDPSALLSPAGLTISAEEADDLLVAGFPPNAPSKVVPALNGDVDTLGDSDSYRSVVKAAKPPKEVGQYGYIDLGAYVEAIFTAISADSPQAARALPTVRNNLADVPGVLTWTTRETFDGHEVGVAETVVPILK